MQIEKSIQEILTTAKNPEFTKAKFLVKKFVKEENINWSREILIGKKVAAKYNIDFLDWLDLGFLCNSLAYFLTEDGQFLLGTKLIEYKKHLKLKNLDFPPQKDYALEDKKLGTDKNIEKQQSLMDILA